VKDKEGVERTPRGKKAKDKSSDREKSSARKESESKVVPEESEMRVVRERVSSASCESTKRGLVV